VEFHKISLKFSFMRKFTFQIEALTITAYVIMFQPKREEDESRELFVFPYFYVKNFTFCSTRNPVYYAPRN
jgi:hypothetical protein